MLETAQFTCYLTPFVEKILTAYSRSGDKSCRHHATVDCSHGVVYIHGRNGLDGTVVNCNAIATVKGSCAIAKMTMQCTL